MNQDPVATPDEPALPGQTPRVLFFGRSGCEASRSALAFIEQQGFGVDLVESNGRGEKLPAWVKQWRGDYILCFRSLFVLPQALIDNAHRAAINFHPGPVEYPGSGCVNFALYDDAGQFGVTAHLMNAKVDNGAVLECRRFDIEASDTVLSLLEKTHAHLLELLFDVVSGIGQQGETYIRAALKSSRHEVWRGQARRIAELDTLQNVSADVSADELARIIRATHTPQFPTRLYLHGYRFDLKLPE